MSGQVWLLLTAGAGRGVAHPLTVSLSTGVHGEGLRRIDVASAGTEIQRGATHAAGEAVRILYREGYLDRKIIVRYAASGLENAQGRSAELAFALALTAAAVERALPPVAATGIIEAGGAIRAIAGVAEKLAAALEVLPRNGVFVYPAANNSTITPRLRSAASERGIALMPAHRLEDLLARLGLPITRTWLDEPFRGLEPFGFAHASIFFGRADEIARLAELVSKRMAVLVRGPSGSGKSSLVLAGLLPALIRREAGGEGVRWGLLRPRDLSEDADPRKECDLLARTLALGWCHEDEGGLGAAAAEGPLPSLDPIRLVAWLRDWGAARPVWVIDQLEDLFDSRLHPETVDRLCEFLAGLPGLGVTLVATITNAALPRLAALAGLNSCFGVAGQFALEPRHDAALLDAVIHGPAATAGLAFETGLDAELLASSSHGGADVLPLLELLLTELYERRDPGSNVLRWDDFRAVAGLDGVISARAEAVYLDLDADERDAVPLLLWLLASSGEVDTKDFSQDHPLHRVLNAYQARRLLVRDDRDGQVVARAAHEALLRHWGRAVTYWHENEADLCLWADLTREADQLRRGERALIPTGPQLNAARTLFERRRGLWTECDRATIAYIDQSAHARQRRRLITGLAMSAPLLGGLGWVGVTARRAWLAARETRINFDDISVPGPSYVIAADPYLNRLGISVLARNPASARIVIRNNLGIYQGRGADPVAGQNFLTEEIDDAGAPISFTLNFVKQPRRIGLMRAALWAATSSGVTHPSWTMDALDPTGRVLDTAQEDLLRGMLDPEGNIAMLDLQAQVIATISGSVIPARLYEVAATDGGTITSVRITSDYRLGGIPFAGMHAVLINELVLYYD